MMTSTGLLEVEDALRRILSTVAALPGEWVSVEDALGRALAAEVTARRTLPPWNNSAMDGYAVRSADLSGAPVSLKVVETIAAGGLPQRTLGLGDAARIFTGAPLPKGADAVVMQEKTRAVRGASGEVVEVEVSEPVPSGSFVRAAGEDAWAGAPLLPAGTPMGIPEAALLWAQGMTRAQVPRRPRVAIVSTGDELCGVDEAFGDRLVDTNAPALAAAVARAGAVPTILGIARDDPGEVRALLERALEFDVVLSTAGVSVGERDHVKGALEALGVETVFWRVAIKPGKPLYFGRRGRVCVFGLPGNPTSSLVTFELFVRPALRRMLGHEDARPPRVSGRIGVELRKAAGLTHFVRVSAEWRDGTLWAHPLGSQTSGALRSAAAASHLLVFPAAETRLTEGAPVEMVPVSWSS
ncbi:MAG: gephyrin-like molybdotransferase Glp [Myxococcaceae bacterium]